MADWTVALPKTAAEGDPGHVEAHNALAAAISEARANVDENESKVPDKATVDNLSGTGATGKAVMKAADAATARSAIGAGTSSVKVGSGAGDAKAGDYKPTWEEITGKPTIPADQSAAITALTARVKALEDAQPAAG